MTMAPKKETKITREEELLLEDDKFFVYKVVELSCVYVYLKVSG